MNISALTLEPGDRVPNFILPNHEGNGIMFYNKTHGGPALLMLYDRNDDKENRRDTQPTRQNGREGLFSL